MLHLDGPLNATDKLTKALAWALHSKHAHRLMGHFLLLLSRSSKASVHSMLTAGEGLEAGRVLELKITASIRGTT